MSDYFQRMIFEPRPGAGDVQWLDWDGEREVFCGGSFGAEAAGIEMVGFTAVGWEDLAEEAELTVECGACLLADPDEAPSVVGQYLVVVINGDSMVSPARVVSLQEVEREVGE